MEQNIRCETAGTKQTYRLETAVAEKKGRKTVETEESLRRAIPRME